LMLTCGSFKTRNSRNLATCSAPHCRISPPAIGGCRD